MYVVEGTDDAGHVDDVVPEAAALMSKGALGSKPEVEAEIDAMLAAVRNFWQMEPDLVMRDCAAYSSRCTELYVHLHRVEGQFREWKQVRTQHVVPLLDELERQYKIASRLVEIRRQDLETLRTLT